MEVIKESFFEVIKGSISVRPEESIIPLKKGYLTSIEMIGRETNVLLVFNKPFLKTMCFNFLGDKNPSNDALEDMARELANLTVGHAKVIAQERKINFNISTPEFLGVRVIKDYDQGAHFRLKGSGHCSIFLRSSR
ncbi:chemotaxis protein CheX [Helicobacter sp.]|uniref:chemotaxis protein CheX n=1 Tax=Helicobacter sp. TaxID=218 RepID=UPI0025C546DF|nr:chemotaxis protein CheX [Helicobacter sp.]MBR2495557.1 chemotaxis protein CheX [Helicobacter sp.]